jgi:hypothetical protein
VSTPRRLVPGIEKYPDLETNLETKLSRHRPGCADCNLVTLAQDFREKLRARLERDKSLRRP